MDSQSRGVVLLIIGALAIAGSVGAVPAPRDQPAETTPPVRVFVGETLNVSAVELTGGGTVGTERVTLIGESGAAEGNIVEIPNPTAADFSDVSPGTYYVNADSDDDIEFAVRKPRVTSTTIRNQNGANVTNGWEPTGEDLTVTAEYNFDVADRLDVTVHDSSGFDITKTVTTNARITTSGGSVEVDLSSQPDGTYRIAVSGSTLDSASRTVTVRTGPRDTATRTQITAQPTAVPTTITTTSYLPTTAPTDVEPSPTSITPPTTTTESTPVSPSVTQTTTTSTSIHGFGLAVTLLAVLTATTVMLRRN